MHIGHQYKMNYTIRQDNTQCIILKITEEKDLGVLTPSPRKLSLTTLRTRRLCGDLIETYKIITGKENKVRKLCIYIPTAAIQRDTASSLLPQEAD